MKFFYFKRLFVTSLLFVVVFFDPSNAFTLKLGSKKTGFYAPGETVVIPILISPEYMGEELPLAGAGNSDNYVFSLINAPLS